eukprot:8221578-Alexandrium_andersonii.AAC.1
MRCGARPRERREQAGPATGTPDSQKLHASCAPELGPPLSLSLGLAASPQDRPTPPGAQQGKGVTRLRHALSRGTGEGSATSASRTPRDGGGWDAELALAKGDCHLVPIVAPELQDIK